MPRLLALLTPMRPFGLNERTLWWPAQSKRPGHGMAATLGTDGYWYVEGKRVAQP